MNRLEAAEAGERFYEAKPCRHDGDTKRYVSSGSCVTCQAKKAKTYSAKIFAARLAAKGPAQV